MVPYYPVFLDLRGRSCVVIGAGPVAVWKARSLVRAGAEVTVVSPESPKELRERLDGADVNHVARSYREGDLRGAFLVIGATDDPDVQRRVREEASQEKVLCNVVDVAELCDFIAPAILERGSLQVAVSTSGAAPRLAGRVRDRIGDVLGPEYALVVDLLGRIRDELREGLADPDERRSVLLRLAESNLPELVARRDGREIDRLLERAGARGCTLDSLAFSLEEEPVTS